MPATGVYFVNSWSSASCAAIFTAFGVGKSGSPAPKSMTSTPSRRRRSTVAVTFIVGEMAMREVRAASVISDSLLSYFLPKPLFDQFRHQAADAAAEREHFLDQPRADVGVLLCRHHEHRLD